MKNKIVKQLLGISVATVLFAQLPMFVLADTYDISKGDITITATADDVHTVTYYEIEGGPQQTKENDTDPVVTGSFTSEYQDRTVTINAAGGDANVTFSDLNIANPDSQYDENDFYGTPAVITLGTGNVEIELEGTNSLTSGQDQAGLQKENEGELIIKDDNPSQNGTLDSLTATGGIHAAGIGGGNGKAGTDIIIKGGNITANGGIVTAAAIGGGYNGDGSVTIYNGNITANAVGAGAGIGSGLYGDGTVIINGGTINATSGGGAGIGSGSYGDGTVIINGGTINATSGNGAAIGSGWLGNGIVIINEGSVTAIGIDVYDSAIGCGINGSAIVRINGGEVTAIGGPGGAGIGGSRKKEDRISVTVSGSAIVNAVGGQSRNNVNRGAAIGTCGGSEEGDYRFDSSGLLPSGIIRFYMPGTTADQIKNDPTLNLDPAHPTIIGTFNPNLAKNTDQTIIIDTDNNDSDDTPAYQGITTDMLIRQINGSLLTSNGGAITIDFGRNICLTPELMKALFETGKVAKNCTFTYKGKRYNLYIPLINTKSDKYIKAMEVMKKEDKGKGFAGFKRVREIYKDLGVTLQEIE